MYQKRPGLSHSVVGFLSGGLMAGCPRRILNAWYFQ
jgi:hypothetical protein